MAQSVLTAVDARSPAAETPWHAMFSTALPNVRAGIAVIILGVCFFLVSNTLFLIGLGYRPWRAQIDVVGAVLVCLGVITVCRQYAADIRAARVICWFSVLFVGGQFLRIFEESSWLAEPVRYMIRVAAPNMADLGVGVIALVLVGLMTSSRRQALAIASAQDSLALANQALREQAERLDLATRQGGATLWDWNLAEQRIYRDAGLGAMLGYSAAALDALGGDWRPLWHPAERDRNQALLIAHLRGESPVFECEHRLRKHDGGWRWVLTRGRVVQRDPAGRALRITGAHFDIHERKRIEAELEENRQWFDLAVAGGQLGVWNWNPITDELLWNAQWAALLGYEADDLPRRGATWTTLTHPEDHAHCRQAILDHLRGLAPAINVECRMRTKDGRWHWVNSRGQVIERNEAGIAVRASGVLIDIDGRKRWEVERARHEHALLTATARYEAAIAAAGLTVFDWDIACDTICWSGKFTEVFGYSAAEMPQTFGDALQQAHPDDLAWLNERRDQMLATQNAGPGFIVRLRHRDGPYRSVKCVSTYVVDSTTGAGRLVGFLVDVTPEVEAEAALRESEGRFRTMADAVPALVLTSNALGGVNYVNQRWLDLTGSRATESFGERWAQFVHPEDRDRCLQTYRAAVDRPGPISIEGRVRRYDGEYRWMFCETLPRWVGEQFNGFITVCIDITERHQAEEETRQLSRFRQAVIETAAEGICVWQFIDEPPFVRFTIWNDRMYALTGYTLDEINATGWRDALHPGLPSRQLATERLLRLKAGDQLCHELWEVRRKDGTWRTLSISSSPFETSEGRELTVALMHDVTERVAAERALRLSEQKLRLAVEAAHLIPWHWNFRDNVVVDWCTGERHDGGVAPTYSGFMGIINPDDQLKVIEATQRAIDEDALFEVELRAHDGEEIHWMYTRGRVLRDERNEPYAMAGVALDVTERKAAEQALLREQSLLRMINAAQTRFMHGADAPSMFSALLTGLLELTGSEYGLIGEICRDQAGNYLQTHALAGAAACSPDEPRVQPGPELRNLDTWFGEVVRNGEVLIFNDPPQEFAPAGLPPGHPPLRSFAAIPFDSGEELVGLVVLANRPGGFDELMISQLETFRTTAATLIAGYRLERQRAEAEQRLRESDQRWQFAIEGAGDGVWDWNIKAGEVVYSRQWKRMLGYAEDEIEGRPDDWAQRVHPADVRRVYDALQRHLLGETPHFGHEYRIRRKDGNYIWVLDRGMVIVRDNCGQPIRAIGTLADITERKQAEEERNRMWNLSLDLLSIGSFDGYLKQVNPAWSRLLGWSEPELLAHAWLHFVHPEDQDATIAATKRLLNGTPILGFENRFRCADGGYRWLSWNAFPLSDLQTTFAVTRDVTERKETEFELVRYRDHLEALVDARTQELEESRRQLVQSERLASVGTLAAGIAHEINNPVGTILLSAQVALRQLGPTTPPERAREALQAIVNDAKRCGRIVRSVLQFSRQQATDKWPAQLNDCVHQAALSLRKPLADREIALQLDLDESLPPVRINPTEMEQVLVNLLQNAAEASKPRSSIRVTSNVDGAAVRMAVIDQGHGMSSEVRARLFDPFFTTRRNQGGTGLGMSIAYGIIMDHDGAMHVDTEVGRGTTITVELPTGILSAGA
ncbi:MAG: PAS domain-containing protein [Pirellulales bacterium]|nr:PAS domain-containing protein [Pirellulales bacterium]